MMLSSSKELRPFCMGRATALGQWGWKLFARKGNRNVAVAALAR
ncbi:MAG: hypothetical protein WCC08_05540 [Terrimicrobiaceae bacterium]